MKFGFIGLGRMGKNMVLLQLEKGNQVVVWNRSEEPKQDLLHEASKIGYKSQLIVAETLEGLVENLRQEKSIIIWLMVAAGGAVDEIIKQLIPMLSPSDLIIDGGNSFYRDSQKRKTKLSKYKIHFMDVGTSGGLEGARTGACLMIGGDKRDFLEAEEIFKAAAAPNSYGYLGATGSGHFAKMIHNGIEYGMMEAIGEGAAMLHASEFDYDLSEVFRVYNNKSIIESRLVNWTLNELKDDSKLTTISSIIGSAGGAGKQKGEGHWTVRLAKKLKVDVPVIKSSVRVRDHSEKDDANSPNGFRNKIVAAMRWQFGGHPVKKL